VFCAEEDVAYDRMVSMVKYLALLTMPEVILKTVFDKFYPPPAGLIAEGIEGHNRAVSVYKLTVQLGNGEYVASVGRFVQLDHFKNTGLAMDGYNSVEECMDYLGLAVKDEDYYPLLFHIRTGAALVFGVKGVSSVQLLNALLFHNALVNIHWLSRNFSKLELRTCERCAALYYEVKHKCDRMMRDIVLASDLPVSINGMFLGMLLNCFRTYVDLPTRLITVRDIAMYIRLVYRNRFEGDDYRALSLALFLSDDVRFNQFLVAVVRRKHKSSGKTIKWARDVISLDLSYVHFRYKSIRELWSFQPHSR
jgi:hypothetical protein